jgi:hypothetical protein
MYLYSTIYGKASRMLVCGKDYQPFVEHLKKSYGEKGYWCREMIGSIKFTAPGKAAVLYKISEKELNC